jgi:methylmalonyl-CoA mutase N-terminal domain/subunit
VPILSIGEGVAAVQHRRLADVRRRRDQEHVERTLAALVATAQGTGNTMPPLLDCARAYVTVGEMCGALRQVWGEYHEAPSI